MPESARSFVRLPLRDVVARLQSPLVIEDFSALTGAAALVVDLGAAADVVALEPPAVARALERLRVLPCPSIGVRTAAVATAHDAPGAAGAGHVPDDRTTAGARSEAPGPGARDGVTAVRPRSTESDPSAFVRLRPSPPPENAVEAALDVLVGSQEELDLLLDAVALRPLASMALVQLLRHGETLGVHEALVAESLVYSTLQSGREFQSWLAAHARATPVAAQDGPAVRVERDGARVEIVLDRPQRHNAYSVEMRDALVEALALVVADASIEEAVLRGNGPSFCAGGDLAEFGSLPDPATAHAVRSTRNAARLLSQCARRVRVEVHGACIGAGIELPAFASRVAARRGAFFQLPEVAMGLVPGAGGTASIPRRIGRQRTAYLALSGERIDATTALCWGLIDELGD